MKMILLLYLPFVVNKDFHKMPETCKSIANVKSMSQVSVVTKYVTFIRFNSSGASILPQSHDATFPSLPSPPSPSLFFLFFPFSLPFPPFPFLSLKVEPPQIRSGSLGSAVSSPSGVPQLPYFAPPPRISVTYFASPGCLWTPLL